MRKREKLRVKTRIEMLLATIIVLVFSFVFVRYSINWYYPIWADFAINSTPIKVIDINPISAVKDSKYKTLRLKDLIVFNGEFSSDLVISFVEAKYLIQSIFKNEPIDRSDYFVISPNNQEFIFVVESIFGAKNENKKLIVNPKINNKIIVTQISTGRTFIVKLRSNVYPQEMRVLENEFSAKKKQNTRIPIEDIKKHHELSEKFNKKMLSTPLRKIILIKEIS